MILRHIVLLLLAGSPAMVSAQERASAPLLANGGFEEGLSRGWKTSREGPSELDEAIYFDGLVALHLQLTSGFRVLASQTVRLERGRSYRLTLWARGEGLSSQGAALVGLGSGESRLIELPGGSFSWRQLSAVFTVPSDSVDIRVMGRGEGEFWLDNVDLVALNGRFIVAAAGSSGPPPASGSSGRAGQSDTTTAEFQRALELERAGNNVDALAGFQRIAVDHPDNGAAWFRVGANQYRLNNNTQALNAYQRALELNPRSSSTHNNIGLIHERLGNHASAIASYLRALEITPGNGTARGNLGYAYVRSGDRAKAMEQYELLKATDSTRAARLKQFIDRNGTGVPE